MSPGYTAVVIHLPNNDGVVEIERITVPDGDFAGLGFLQKMVGGYIEHVASADGSLDFWLNEEGKLPPNNLPVNNVATDLLWLVNSAFRGVDVLVGNVVLTGHNREETASIPDGWWELLQQQKWQVPVKFIEEGK